jgi:polyisoprenoid-binding protein YceI
MRALRTALPLAIVCLLIGIQSAFSQVWKVEGGSQLRFTFLQQGSPVEGRFGKFTADISFDPDHLSKSLFEVEIDTSSIDTGHKDRDTLLRSSNFFYVEMWPMAQFASGPIRHKGGNAYETDGRLTIRGVTKNVLLPFSLVIGEQSGTPGRERAVAKGELTISRLDYGIGQGEWASTKTVGDQVVIAFEIRASRKR